jgi:hypothetical protein
MKPLMLASPRIATPSIKAILELGKDSEAGEICQTCINQWNSLPFYGYLRQCGYQKRACRKYSNLEMLFVDGSVKWHDDPGFGVIACWLIYRDGSSYDCAQLITRHGPLSLHITATVSKRPAMAKARSSSHDRLLSAGCGATMGEVAGFRSIAGDR